MSKIFGRIDPYKVLFLYVMEMYFHYMSAILMPIGFIKAFIALQ